MQDEIVRVSNDGKRGFARAKYIKPEIRSIPRDHVWSELPVFIIRFFSFFFSFFCFEFNIRIRLNAMAKHHMGVQLWSNYNLIGLQYTTPQSFTSG